MTKEQEKAIEHLEELSNYCALKNIDREDNTFGEFVIDIQKIKNLIQTQQEEIEKARNTKSIYYENKELRKELEKKDKIIDEAKKYCEQIMNYEKYEKKHSKLSRELVRIAEGLTTHYKMWRVANNINNILKGR